MKYVIPNFVWTWPRGQVDSRSWDAAIDVVQQSLLAIAAGDEVSADEDRVLTAVFLECEELRARKYLEIVPTNAELAAKYAISLRTVRNWRREGCPFERGQWHVLDWLASRRYAPAGAREKFGKRLEDRKTKAIFAGVHAIRAELLELKMLHKKCGVPCPDWLRKIRFRAR